MPDPNDYLSGDFNPDWDSLEDLDYDPTDYEGIDPGGSGTYTEWYENVLDQESFDMDFEGLSGQYTADAMFGGMALSEMTGEQLSSFLFEIGLGASGGAEDQDAWAAFMEDAAPYFGGMAGGPDLSNIIDRFELDEQQAWGALDQWTTAYGGQLETDIAALEGNYTDAIDLAMLQQETALDSLTFQKQETRDAALSALLGSKSQRGKGVRGGRGKVGSKGRLNAYLEALQGLGEQQTMVNQTASDAIEFAAGVYGSWEDGMQTGDMGTAQQALETSYNLQAGLEIGDLQADLEMMQAEFGLQVGAAYDEWYNTLIDRLYNLGQNEYGGYEFDFWGQPESEDYFPVEECPPSHTWNTATGECEESWDIPDDEPEGWS